MDNINKIKRILKIFKESNSTDYDFFAYEIEGIFTGYIPAKHFIINEFEKNS